MIVATQFSRHENKVVSKMNKLYYEAVKENLRDRPVSEAMKRRYKMIGRKGVICLVLILAVLVSSALALLPVVGESEIVTLPAGCRSYDTSDLGLDQSRLLISLGLSGSGQTVYVNPGDTVTGVCTYQIYSGAGNPNEINQGFFIMSWTPSWPPPSGYYIPIWNGISGVYPGVTNTADFSFRAPTTPGTYYLYWCGGAHYSMQLAVSMYNQQLTLPAHAKIVVAIPSQSITVTCPNGGEDWRVGSEQTITWTSSGVTGNVHIGISRDGGASWSDFIQNTANDGSEFWPVTGPATTQARIRVTSASDGDIWGMSDNNFIIPSIAVTSPNGGENWAVGSTQTITWTSIGVTGNVDISISRNGGSTGSGIIQNTANDGSESWTVTGPATTQARIYVQEHLEEGGNVAGDWSDSNFVISSCVTPGTPSLVSPSHGGSASTAPSLDWNGVSGATSYDVQVCTDSGCANVLRSSNDVGSNQWTVSPPLDQGTQYWWHARAKNSCGSGSWSSVWTFTTQTPGVNNPPNTPSNPSPSDDATDIPVNAILSWNGGDPDPQDTVIYDVYFGTSSDPPLDVTIGPYPATQSSLTHWPNTVGYHYNYNTKYHWKVVATDSHGASTTGPLLDFTTQVPPNGWIRFVMPGAIVLAGIVLLGAIWRNTTLRMKRNMKRWEEEGYDLSDWR
jgi:hypothetical protein